MPALLRADLAAIPAVPAPAPSRIKVVVTDSSHYEELANSITHGFGLLLATAGTVVLIVVAALHGTPRHIVTCSIYSGTLVFMYAASTVYHTAREPRLKHVLRVIDHSAIYLLIAGT